MSVTDSLTAPPVPFQDEEQALLLFRRRTIRLLKAAKNDATAVRGMIDDLETIRADQLAILCREMGGKIDELIRLFALTTGETLVEIKAAMERRDFRQVSALAHRLKGSASNFGAARMMAICERLERSVADDASTEPATLVEKLTQEYRLVSRALRE